MQTAVALCANARTENTIKPTLLMKFMSHGPQRTLAHVESIKPALVSTEYLVDTTPLFIKLNCTVTE